MAITLAPNFSLAHNNLGFAYQNKGMRDEAIACYRQAITLDPDYAEAYGNLGTVLKDQGKLTEAEANFRQAITLQPKFTKALNNLGTALICQGKINEAIACFQRLLKLDPGFADAHSNLLFCYNYHPTLSAAEIYNAYQQWNSQHAARLTQNAPPHHNLPDPQRRLKIGYVSPDFRNHSVIHFAGPLISQHDNTRFEVFCYYNHFQHDAYTERMVAASAHWIPCKGLSDAELAQRIRDDGIDILIDLAGHTAGNRLLAFARRPAPVQASWLGFGYTTGLTAMDYFIGDAIFTPPEAQPYFSEKLYCLPHRTAVYSPPENVPEPGDSPAKRNGYVTFACLSRSERINARVLETWATILQRLPDAHLRLDSRNFGDPGLRDAILAQFAAHGIAENRLEIGFTTPAWDIYRAADIALDCFPHNSGTTNYEALWMGLPVITLADRPSVGRSGASLLTCIGKAEWIATNSADYVNRVVALAQNHALLEQHRLSLRTTMRNSPLTDQAAFINDMEQAYIDMWQQWCSKQSLT